MRLLRYWYSVGNWYELVVSSNWWFMIWMMRKFNLQARVIVGDLEVLKVENVQKIDLSLQHCSRAAGKFGFWKVCLLREDLPCTFQVEGSCIFIATNDGCTCNGSKHGRRARTGAQFFDSLKSDLASICIPLHQNDPTSTASAQMRGNLENMMVRALFKMVCPEGNTPRELFVMNFETIAAIAYNYNYPDHLLSKRDVTWWYLVSIPQCQKKMEKAQFCANRRRPQRLAK